MPEAAVFQTLRIIAPGVESNVYQYLGRSIYREHRQDTTRKVDWWVRASFPTADFFPNYAPFRGHVCPDRSRATTRATNSHRNFEGTHRLEYPEYSYTADKIGHFENRAHKRK